MAASLVRSVRVGCQVWKLLRPAVVLCEGPSRGVKRWRRPYLQELYNRRLKVGPEKERHRSEWINWNYDAELYAFGKRLGEEFSTATLTTAFIHRSYIEKEEKRRADLGIDIAAAPLGLTDNTQLLEKGEALVSHYIKAYLRSLYPALYEEGVCAIHDYLMTEETVAHVARHIGIADLMLCADFPPKEETLKNTFLAVVGALQTDQGDARAEALVRDLVLTQLVGQDIGELWTITNPMGLLVATLHAQGRGLPESRLLWAGGKRTVMSVYHVGIYSDRQLIGQSPGETSTIAEEMAALDALRHIMGITESRTPLAFRSAAEKMHLDYNRTNPRAEDVLRQYEQSQQSQQKTV